MLADFVVDLLPTGSLSVRFPYDPAAVSLVKQVPGRRWHKEQKYWSIPAPYLRSLEETCAKHGVRITCSAKVKQALALGDQRRAELEQVRQDETPLDLPTPTTPRPFQYAGVRFLRHALRNFKGVLLADDMGLGKTFQALSLIAAAPKLQRVLVLAPTTLKWVWAAEIEKHYPQLGYVVVEGPAKVREQQWGAARITIANYDLLIRDVAVRALHWDMVICDEVTALKNYKAQRTKAAKKLNRTLSLGLSGIPIENRLEELHSIMDFCIPGVLGPGWVFVQEHVVRDPWGKVVGYRGIDQVKARIGPYYLRRTKAQVLPELPDKVYTDYSIELSTHEWELYDAVRKQILAVIEENPRLSTTNVLVEMLRLKQIAIDAELVGESLKGLSAKTEAISDIMEAAQGHKVVFFTQFAQYGRKLASFLEAPLIEGAVPAKARVKMVADFQTNGQRALVSTDAGAYGITLTAADIVVHVDQPWNPARLRQREDRLHRLGQEHDSVQVVHLMARRTIDEKIRGILHSKLQLVKAVLDEEDDLAGAATVDRNTLISMLRE